MTLPDTEHALHNHFGDDYNDKEWRHALDVVMDSEGDAETAILAINKLLHATRELGKKMHTKTMSPTSYALTAQCQALEKDLLYSLAELKGQNNIHGEVPTLDDLLTSTEENTIGDSPYQFEGGYATIVAEVCQEQAVI